MTDIDDCNKPCNPTFRDSFKYYKRRVPKPNFDRVIDLRDSIDLNGRISSMNLESGDFKEFDQVGLKPPGDWNVKVFADKPGLFVLSDIFRDRKSQMNYVAVLVNDYPGNIENRTNLDTECDWSQRRANLSRLRWTTLGYQYDWTSKSYEHTSKTAFPREFAALSSLIARSTLNIQNYRAEAAIVNYYDEKSTLSGHVDRSEWNLSAPLFSFSFGQSAIYLTGGESLDEQPDAIWLRSGDVMVMHAQQRMVYHGVPRIVIDQKFTSDDFSEEDSSILLHYINSHRINVSVRQVDHD